MLPNFLLVEQNSRDLWAREIFRARGVLLINITEIENHFTPGGGCCSPLGTVHNRASISYMGLNAFVSISCPRMVVKEILPFFCTLKVMRVIFSEPAS